MEKKVKVEGIVLDSTKITVNYSVTSTKKEDIKKTILGKEYVIGEKNIVEEAINDSTSLEINKDFFTVLVASEFNKDVHCLEVKEFTVTLPKKNMYQYLGIPNLVDAEYIFLNHKKTTESDLVNLTYRFVVVDGFILTRIAQKYLLKKFPGHQVYSFLSADEIFIIKNLSFKVVGRYKTKKDKKLYIYDVSVKLNFNNGKYFLEDDYEDFKFIGAVDSSINFEDISDKDIDLSINSHQKFLDRVEQEIAVLNK